MVRAVEAIAQKGLKIEGASGEKLVHSIRTAKVTTNIGRCDLIIIATKASGVADAACALGPLLGPDTLVLAMQNGLGAGEMIARPAPPCCSIT